MKSIDPFHMFSELWSMTVSIVEALCDMKISMDHFMLQNYITSQLLQLSNKLHFNMIIKKTKHSHAALQ